MTGRVLIANDESPTAQSLLCFLGDCGYDVSLGTDSKPGPAVDAGAFDAVLVDLSVSEEQGLARLVTLTEAHPGIPLIALCDQTDGQVSAATEAGAWACVVDPVTNKGQVQRTLSEALERARLLRERDRYAAELGELKAAFETELARQTGDLRSQNRRLSAMNRVAHAVSHAFELDTMLDRALDAALNALEAKAGLIQLLNPTTEAMYIAAARGFGGQDVPFGQALPSDAGLAGQVVQDGNVKISSSLSSDDCIPGLDLRRFRSCALVPLHASDGTVYWEHERSRRVIVGLLGIFSDEDDAFDADEVELLTMIGNQLGVAVTRAQYAADLTRANLQLESANQELKRLDAMRAQFIQNVTHELRTPLALVRGYIELLADGDLDPDHWPAAVGVARKRVLELVEIVEAITTLQDIGSDPLQVEPISLVELVMTACQMTQQRATSSGIKFRYGDIEAVTTVPGDFSRLAQALHQVLDNACKFSEPETEVTVSTAVSGDGRFVAISVADHGIGIPDDEMDRIFERFYQIDGSATRRYGGTGLGLALARETLEAHGGWIRVESEVRVGSTFTLGLPLDVE